MASTGSATVASTDGRGVQRRATPSPIRPAATSSAVDGSGIGRDSVKLLGPGPPSHVPEIDESSGATVAT